MIKELEVIIMKKDNTSQRKSRDVEIELQDFPEEEEHRLRWSCTYINHILLSLPDDGLWNSMMCILVFSATIHSLVICHNNIYSYFFDLMYNIIYATHVLTLAYSLSVNTKDVAVDVSTTLGFVLDIISYMFYLVHDENYSQGLCYYLRLHRPLRYLWSLNEKKIQSSVLGTTLKYCYIFMILRLTWAMIWLIINELSKLDPDYPKSRKYANTSLHRFLNDFYLINKMFLPIGPSVAPINNIERVACLMVMLTGCLVVTGAAVASLSFIISIYMRPEENFQTRYRLIMKEMEAYNIPPSLRDKVETFYKMYWHKQRAVSVTELLPIFPPSLTATIYTDIYFKATQKSRILRDLAYQFLSEIAKNMETIHYIPGDAIIKRNHRKSSIIYITYGDIEMLTAEDDSTAMLRLIRGTILSPCAGCPAAGCGRAHVEIRAATFCTAHILNVMDLWKTVVKYGKENSQGAMILRAFNEHFEKVKRHFNLRFPVEAKYKSSILNFKRNLMLLKESKDDEGNLLLAQTDVMIEIAGCYIMRNRADASLTDEADAICLRPTFPCILQPKSSLQVAWNLFVTCLILIVCITHPYYLVFQRHVPIEFRFYDYVVTVIYILDLVVYLSTGANVEDGVPITFAQTSSQQARNKWFVLDVIGTLPILEFIHNGHFAGLNKLLRLPKVFRMLKSIEEECVYHSNVIRFVSFSLLIFLACWLLAALQQGFMCFQFGYCVVSNFTHSPYWEQKPLDDETLENSLTFGLYWAISVITFTCHLETWGVENWNNTIYTMFVLEICTVLYIFMEAVYSATIMVTTALREDFDACIENVTNFLIRNDVDSILRDRFIEYLQLRWYTDKAYSITNKQTSIFYDLPAHVYQDIVTRQRSKYILCIPFMKLLHKEDLKNISSKAKLFCTSPNEILLNTGDMSNEMYVIKRGICEILSPETKNVVGELSARNHFGVIQCLLRLPAFYTVRAVTHVEIFSISRKYLLNAIDVPQIKDAIDFCKDQPQYSILQKLRDPFLSYKPPEPTPNMEKFRLPKKYEQDQAFLQPFYTLGMLSVLRYMFPRFTIRPDSSYLVHYEWFRASCALLSAIVYPCYTYMVLQWPWLYFFTLLLDFSAYFDILQRMLIGYYNEKGILVYHPTSTAGHYLKGAFMVDLFGVLPLERLESSWKKSLRGKYKEAPTKQFLMLNRLMQLYRMPSALLGLTGSIRRDLLLVIKATPIFLALLSTLTCFVVYYSVEIFYSINDNSWAIVPLKDAGGSWINLFHSTFRFNLTESPWNLHLASYFWVVYETTTTGYSSFKPTNFNIMRVLIAGMIIGAMITTYFSVRIISIRANVNNALASFQEHMKDIGVFMKRENLNLELQNQVLEYYKFNWDKTSGLDYRNVLKLCDQITLRTDAILHIYGPTFTKCPILYKCDISLLRIIGRAVRSCYFLRNTTVIDVDEVISDIYFVDHGSVELVDSKRLDDKIILTKGSIFGNLEGPSTIRCPVSMTTSTQVHLLQINSQAFFSIVSDFPAVAKLLTLYRPSNENYINAIKPSIQFSPKKPSVVCIRGQVIASYFQIKQSFIRIYLIIVCSLCIYADVYNAGFQDNRPLLIIGLYLLDFCFFWKFLIQYFLPLLVESSDEDVLHSLMKFRNEYFKQEFKYDLISFLPIELLCFLSHSNRGMVFSWLRLNRLWRIVTVYKCLKRHHERISINLTLTTTCSVLIWFTMFVHVSTCLWHFIGSMEEKNTPKSSWIYKDNGEPWCQNDYICSLYFVMTTFTQNGVGDILPKKQSEVMFVSILQIISTMMYMVYVGELSNIIQYQSYRSFYFYSSYLQLQDFLKNNRVSKVLVKLVNKYSLHLWRETRGLQVPYFLKTAPNCLKLKVMSAAYLYHLRDHHLFRGCELAFLRQLVVYLQLHIYNEDMFIVKEREITDSMYIIHVGRVIETSEKSSRRKSYQAGEYFGELQGIVYDVPFEHSYKTAVKSQILTLSHKDWEDLLTHFPNSKKNIYRYVQSETTSSDGNGDDGIDGRNKNVNFSNTEDVLTHFPKDMPTTTISQRTSIEKNLRKGSSEHNARPGPSNMRSQSADSLNSRPLENKKSYDSYFSDTPTLKVESIYTKSQKLIEGKGRTSKMEVKSSTSQYKERSSEIDTEEESTESLSTIQKSDFKSKHDIKSVEDYILEQQGNRSSLPKSTRSQSTKSSKKLKTPVRYSDSEPTTSGLDSHELKPRRNKSAEERILKSLDSEMQGIQIQDLDTVEEDSDKNDNESSVKEKE